jgi:hypothetical protein
MLVDTDLASISFKRRPTSVTTSLWRRDRVVQFQPNETAVVELLKFLGFQKVSRLKPTLVDLEKRYYNGERGTFLAVRA